MTLELSRLTRRFTDYPALDDVSLEIPPGEFLALLGPSGSGKTTLLRILAGLDYPESGSVRQNGRDLLAIDARRRKVGLVFQHYALFRHLTVADNVAFGLRVRSWRSRPKRAEIAARVERLLQRVQLQDMAKRYPAQLSGGQRQRVALARAVVIRPDVLLLDEPLAALDLKLREELQIEIKRIQSALKITTLFVTHDQSEALSMSDRVAVMHDGRIVQIDSPEMLYERPNSRYVANFVGRTNLLDVVVREKLDGGMVRVETDGASKASFIAAAAHLTIDVGARCLLGVRPEHFHFGDGRANVLQAKVRGTTYLGSIRYVDAEASDGRSFVVQVRPGEPTPARGEVVLISWRPESCFLLKE